MYNVLICDDQPDIVNALKIYLKPDGYRLYVAYNGRQALETVKTEDTTAFWDSSPIRETLISRHYTHTPSTIQANSTHIKAIIHIRPYFRKQAPDWLKKMKMWSVPESMFISSIWLEMKR